MRVCFRPGACLLQGRLLTGVFLPPPAQHWVTRYFDDFAEPALLHSLVAVESRLQDRAARDPGVAQALARLQNARDTRTPSRTVQLRRPTQVRATRPPFAWFAAVPPVLCVAR